MALNERYMFFDSAADDRRLYPSQDFADVFKEIFSNGIFRKQSNANTMRINADGVTMRIGVNAGAACIEGRFYFLDSDGSFDADTVTTTTYYSAVLQLDLSTPERNIHLISKQGSGTAPPDLQRDDSIWELQLGYYIVRAGQSYVSPEDVFDTRNEYDLCGYVGLTGDPAYYPPSELPQLLWSYTMFPQSLTSEQIQTIQENPTLITSFNNSRLMKIVSNSYGVNPYTTQAIITESSEWTCPALVTKVDVWLVGAGGGGSMSSGGGGGGGQCKLVRNISVTSGLIYDIIIGAGGNGGSYVSSTASIPPSDGGNTTAFGQTALGGTAGGDLNGGNGSNGGGGFGNGLGGSGGSGGTAGQDGRIPPGTVGNGLGGISFTTSTNPYDGKRYAGGGGGSDNFGGYADIGNGGQGDSGNGEAGGGGGGSGRYIAIGETPLPGGTGGNGICIIYYGGI